MAVAPATADDGGYRHHRHDSGSFSFGFSTPGYYYDSPGYYYNPPPYYAPPPAPRYYYPPPTYYAPPLTYYYDTEPSLDFGRSSGSHR